MYRGNVEGGSDADKRLDHAWDFDEYSYGGGEGTGGGV
jgi:hypothetical protein